jgi:uncharacterized membrane protein
MASTSKLNQLIKTSRDPNEIQDWLFSLTPLGVAFVFFLVFLLPMDIANKDIILITGIAAGFTGLESYWVFRGWRKNHGSTVLLGLLGIALTIFLAWFYVTFFAQGAVWLAS